MERSLLSQFLKLLRRHRQLTDVQAAQKMDMTLIDYLHLEEHPDLVPMHKVYKLLNVLKVSDSEFHDFCNLADFIMANKNPAVEEKKYYLKN